MQSIEKSIYFHFFLKMIFVKVGHNVDKIFLFSLFTTLCCWLYNSLSQQFFLVHFKYGS